MKLTNDEMNRLSKEGIEYLIKVNEEQLGVWSITKQDRMKLEAEIKELKELLKKAEGKK